MFLKVNNVGAEQVDYRPTCGWFDVVVTSLLPINEVKLPRDARLVLGFVTTIRNYATMLNIVCNIKTNMLKDTCICT